MPLSVLYEPLVTSYTHGAHESFSSVSLVGRVVWCLSGLDDPAVCFEHRPDAKEDVERLLGFLMGGDVHTGISYFFKFVFAFVFLTVFRILFVALFLLVWWYDSRYCCEEMHF